MKEDKKTDCYDCDEQDDCEGFYEECPCYSCENIDTYYCEDCYRQTSCVSCYYVPVV